MNPEQWHWPQYFIATLTLMNLFGVAHLHGKPRTEKYNFFMSFATTALVTGFVLYSGGF
jgi:hypothetical protein